MKRVGVVTVSGHTDNVPLVFGGRYRDNWDLAAARSASVVQELSVLVRLKKRTYKLSVTVRAGQLLLMRVMRVEQKIEELKLK